MLLSASCRTALAIVGVGALATAQITVNPNDRNAVLNLYTNVYLPARANTNHGWTGSVAGCVPGTLNAQFVNDSLTVVNTFRAMAGLPNVTFGNPRSFTTTNSTYPIADCQQGALMMDAAGTLSHTLPPTGPCGTVPGSAALQTSNITVGLVGPGGMELLVQDQGVASLGHRRWMQHEPQQQLAMGATANYMAVEVQGATTAGNRTRFSAWPPAGFVPYPWAYDTWSFAVPGVNQDPFNPLTQADFGNATVTVTQNGTPVPVNAFVPQSCIFCYDNAIAWTFANPLPRFGGMPDTPYTVTIANVANTAQSTYTYVVTIFDAAGATPDECGGALLLADGSNGPFHNNTATNSPPTWPCGTIGNDVWFTYTSTCNGQTTFATCSPNLTLDTGIEVFSGNCGALVSLACNDDSCGTGSSVTVPTVLGQTYKVRVGGFGGARGNFDVVVSRSGCTGSFQTLAHHCGAVTLNHTGTASLGTTTTFTVGNATGVPIVFFGLTLLNNTAFCTPCTVGPDPQGWVLGNFALNVPANPIFVGVSLKVQGADFGGSGGCAAPSVAFSDTVVVTIA